ncbi:MAG: PEGA domain-containing protein [Chthoniobacterales bacterium]
MKISSVALLGYMFVLSSCATITRGVHEKLRVESDPAGADVVLSTGEKGVTPAVFVEKRRRDNFTVTVSKPGYVSQTIIVQSKAGGTGATAMAGNMVLGGVIGMGVDAGTGAYNSLYPNPVRMTLKKTGSAKSKTKMTTRESASPKPVASPR